MLLKKCALFLLFTVVLAPALLAQDYPPPTHLTQSPSVCPPNVPIDPSQPMGTPPSLTNVNTIKSICPKYPSLQLPQYSGPLTRYLGRFVDSNRVRDFQAGYGMRTLRANKVIVAPETNRVYMIIGSTFAQWDIGSFFGKIGGSLVPNAYPVMGLSPIASRPALGYPVEKHLQWDGYAFPEDDYDYSDWHWVLADGQERLYGISYDDRGYVYLAYNIFGWGIVSPNLEMDAPAVAQVREGIMPANGIFAFKASNRYYAVVTDGQSNSAVYDTTTPTSPVLVANLGFAFFGEPGMTTAARISSGGSDIVALATINGTIRIYNGDSLAAGGGPLATISPGGSGFYSAVDSDGSRFYGVVAGITSLKFAIIGNTTGAWTAQIYQPGETFESRGLRVGAGYLTVFGNNQFGRVDVRLYKLVDGAPAPLPTEFFTRYYSGWRASTAEPQKAQPAGYTAPAFDVLPANYQGRTVLFASFGGLGDVYEVEGTGSPFPTPTPGTPTPTPSQSPTPTPSQSPTPTPTPPPGGGSCGQPQLFYIEYKGRSSNCPASGNCLPTETIDFHVRDYYDSQRFSRGCADTFQWDFGDSNPSTQAAPARQISSTRTIRVRLNGGTTANKDYAEQQVLIGNTTVPTPTPTPTPPTGEPTPTPSPTPPPVNSCSAAPGPNDLQVTYQSLAGGSGCNTSFGHCAPGETLEFEVSRNVWVGSTYSLGSCHTITWTFPGGGTANGATVQRAINATGDQSVSVTVAVAGQQRSFPLTVKLSGPPAEPVTAVDFTASATTVAIDKPVTFTAAAQPDDTNVTFNWDFDGVDSTIERTGKQVEYTWTTPGNRTVTVTASRGGSSAVASKQIKVTPKNTYAFLLPVVAHVPGQNGARWRTDLQIYNPDPAFVPSSPLVLEVEFKGQVVPLTIDSSTKILEDFMTYVQSGDGSGSMVIRGNSPVVPQMWTRTYTVGPTGVGTYGQLIPAVPLDESQNVVAGASRYFVAGLESSGRFRTNLGLINPTPTAVDVEVTAFDDRGFPYGAFTTSVQPFALLQVNDLNVRIPTLPNDGSKYSLRIVNQTGTQIVAYQSTIDQISNDPIYIGALSDDDAIRTAMRIQWVPGVAKLANGNWKTDFTVFNPDEQGMQVDVTYFDASGAPVSNVPNYTLAAKSFVSIADILRSGVFNVPSDADSFGSIKVETRMFGASQAFPLVYARTYSDRAALGTFGQGIPAFSEANVNLNSPAFIPGVRSNNAYRTNVGLLSLATSGDTKVRVILLDKVTGVEVGSWSPATPLQPNQLLIVPDFIRNAIGSVTDQGSLKIVVDEGGPVWGFASIIDQMTSDAEYVPGIPLAPVAP